MTESASGEMIPISALNVLEYCPRRFYYQFVQGEMLINDLMLEGILAHQRVHQAGTHTTGEGEIQITRLYLSSETLRLTGFADVIEERAGVLIPIEYKHGQQGQWLNDHIQLCAQALCLEERQQGKPPLAYGYIYSLGSRRRVRVPFTPQLRVMTREAIIQATHIATLEIPPPPLSGTMAVRCPDCSLLPLCLPEEVRQLQSQKKRGSG